MLFIDSANVREVEELGWWGCFGGVTTNQKIWLASGQKYSKEAYKENIRRLCEVAEGNPVSVELTGSVLGALEEAQELHAINPDQIIIKVPMWPNGTGLKVIKLITDEDIRVNATCLMTAIQAVMASDAGASYVSLFYRRMADCMGAQQTDKEFRVASDLIDQNLSPIIAGSIREPGDVIKCLDLGAQIVTVTPKIIKDLPNHPKTEETIAEFDKAWRDYIRG
jgi:transaldolase